MESLFHYLYVYLYCRLTTFVLTKPKVTKIPAKVQTSKRNTPSSMCSHRLQLRNLPEYPDGIFHRTHLLNHHRTAAVSLTQVAAMGIHGSVCDALPESLALEISTLLVLHEIKHHAPGLEEYLFCTEALAETTERHYTNQFLALLRNLSETVFHTQAECLHVFIALQTVQFAIEEHALATAGYIIVGKRHLQIALQRALVHKVLTAQVVPLPNFLGIEVAELIILQFLHGLGQDFLIGFISQIGDETALLGPQQVARPTDVQVLHGDVDTRTEGAEILDGLPGRRAGFPR